MTPNDTLNNIYIKKNNNHLPYLIKDIENKKFIIITNPNNIESDITIYVNENKNNYYYRNLLINNFNKIEITNNVFNIRFNPFEAKIIEIYY